jgi:hypothetical protein
LFNGDRTTVTKRTLTTLLAAAAFIALIAGANAAEITELKAPLIPMGTVTFPNGKTLDLSVGYGSGAFHRPGEPETTFYGITDRGPNIDCAGDTDELLGLGKDAICGGNEAAKVFPIADFDPTIYEFAVGADGTVSIAKEIPLKGADGKKLNGLSNPLVTTTTEGAYGPDGKEIAESPDGFDSESLVKLSDGTFWIGEEYGASIAHVAADGTILKRLVPAGLEGDYKGASYPVEGKLPALVMKRYLNRGIESIAVSPDEKSLYFAIQSPLANPDKDAYKGSRTVRLFKFDIASEAVTGEYAYQIDEPATFVKDNAKKPAKQSDVKVSELAAVGADQLIVLERISKTTKLYRVDLSKATTVPAAFDDAAKSPSLEQVAPADLAAAGVVPVEKTLVLSSDTMEGLPSKVESIAVLGDRDLILISDNDFGIAGDKSKIVKVRLDAPLTN